MAATRDGNILSAVRSALDELIKKNTKLNYLYEHIDEEQLLTPAIIRQKLFSLRKDLNNINPETPELIACKKIVHEKLIYLATNWPLNKVRGDRKICPVSENKVGYYIDYYNSGRKDDIVLSNGYICDFAGINAALRSDQPFPRLDNISEYDVEKIQQASILFRLRTVSMVAPLSLLLSLAIIIPFILFIPALSLIAAVSIALVVGLSSLGAVAAIAYKATNETRSSELLPTCTTTNTNIHEALGSKRSSDLRSDKDESLDSGAALSPTTTLSLEPTDLRPVYNDPPCTNKM